MKKSEREAMRRAGVKRCKDCGELKPADAFNKNAKGLLGVGQQCKACIRLNTDRIKSLWDSGQLSLPATKVCVLCLEEKDASEFGPDRSRRDGLFPYCRICNTEAARVRQPPKGPRPVTCASCKRRLPRTHFRDDPKLKKGRSDRCSDCLAAVAERRQDQARDRAAEQTALARTCRVCGKTKPLDDFYVIPGRRTRLRKCKQCCYTTTAAYMKTHREIYNKAVRKYQKAHPEVARTIAKRRKARKKGAPGDYTRAEWESLKAKYGFRCLMCGLSEPDVKLTADHIVPISKGGSNFISNIQPLCARCNSSKKVKTLDLRPDSPGRVGAGSP